MTNKGNTKPQRTFDEEELLWPDIRPEWTQQQLLQQRGMFKFSKIKHLLKLKTIELTRLSKKCQAEAVDCYRTYGFAKPIGSQYVVRMSVFRHTYAMLAHDKANVTRLRQVNILEIPEHVENANELVLLEGCFRLAEVCRFSPFKEHVEVIKNHIRRTQSQEEAMETVGAWYDRSRREYFVRMETFHDWFLNRIWMQQAALT